MLLQISLLAAAPQSLVTAAVFKSVEETLRGGKPKLLPGYL